MDAIEEGDNVAFTGAMHRGQEYFSHYSKGYRWKPLRALDKIWVLAIFSTERKPDQDINAWKKAEQWTKNGGVAKIGIEKIIFSYKYG